MPVSYELSVTMRLRWLITAIAIATLTGCTANQKPIVVQPAAQPMAQAQWQVYFSPRGGCTEAVVDALDYARKTVRVQAYSFTSAKVAKALLDASKRGVDVRVILDKSQAGQHYSSADFLANSGVPTMIDSAHSIAHNKVMIVDSEIVITGSFNFTKAAEERNAENLLVISDQKLAARYLANWRVHEAHSKRYAGRGAVQ